MDSNTFVAVADIVAATIRDIFDTGDLLSDAVAYRITRALDEAGHLSPELPPNQIALDLSTMPSPVLRSHLCSTDSLLRAAVAAELDRRQAAAD